MSESRGDTASSASERPDRRETILTLATVRNMLPLVRQIVRDVISAQHGLARLQSEQDRLERRRRYLSWPERSRRYQVQEELLSLDQNIQQALAEIEALGLSLFDPDEGRVGFPTMVNGRRAFFSWRLGEDNVRHWHFAGESALRPIPSTWFDAVAVS